VRAANGVVVVTTKKGSGEGRINIDAYQGFQNFYRFPNVATNSYDYMRYLAEAQVNMNGSTTLPRPSWINTKPVPNRLTAVLTGAIMYWAKTTMRPISSVNANFTGSNDRVNYYVSATILSKLTVG
jgi:hypothetical protein